MDDYLWRVWVYPLKNNNEVYEFILTLKNLVDNPERKSIMLIWSYNGGEDTSMSSIFFLLRMYNKTLHN